MYTPIYAQTHIHTRPHTRIQRVGQHHIYTVYIQIFDIEITKYTIIYRVYIRIWSTLHMHTHTHVHAPAQTHIHAHPPTHPPSPPPPPTHTHTTDTHNYTRTHPEMPQLSLLLSYSVCYLASLHSPLLLFLLLPLSLHLYCCPAPLLAAAAAVSAVCERWYTLPAHHTQPP